MKILIVGHPDDEFLWFNPDNFDKIIIVFLHRVGEEDFNRHRDKALLNHPLADIITCLGYPESGLVKKNDTFDDSKKIYLENWRRLEKELPELIKGATEIYTHNQWGEFGHPEHVMINAVVNTIAGDIPIFCRGNLAGKTDDFSMPREEFSDLDRFYELREFYRDYKIWTFELDYRPPDILKFFQEDKEKFKQRKTQIII